MKHVLMFGSKNKTDFTMYVADMLARLGNRVLLVDSTINGDYKYSYVREETGEQLYNFEKFEIVINVNNFDDLKSQLNLANEAPMNYDYIIYDIDEAQVMMEDWPSFSFKMYVSSDYRDSIMRDVEILNAFYDKYPLETIKRMHFNANVKLPTEYIELLTNFRLDFMPIDDPIEYDDQAERLKLLMQHEYFVPSQKLSKEYKRTINSVVTDITKMDSQEITQIIKVSPFKKLFGRKKTEQQLQLTTKHMAKAIAANTSASNNMLPMGGAKQLPNPLKRIEEIKESEKGVSSRG